MTPFELGVEAYVIGIKWANNPFDAVKQAKEWLEWGDGFIYQEHKNPARVDAIKIKMRKQK